MKQKFAYYLKGGRGRNHARTESKSKKEEIFDRILITLLFVSAAVFLLPANRLIVELWHSLALQLMVSYWLFALASMAFKKWNLSLAAAGASLVCMFIIDTGTIDNRAVSPVTSVVMEHAEGVRIKGTQLKVAHFNVLKPNRDFERTLKAVESSEADLISFQEVDDAWMQVLTSRFGNRYPYFKYAPHPGNFGLAIFSRYPFKSVQTHHWEGAPQISGCIVKADVCINFIAAHAYNPIFSPGFRARNRQLNQIAEYVRSVDGPVLAIGDWNSVPWSDAIKQFAAHTGMNDSRRSLQCTYPDSYAGFGIPIDYIFYNDQIACLQFDTLGDTSSDHKGIIGHYSIHTNN